MGRWRRQLSVLCVGLLIWSGIASAYSGTSGIWGFKAGEYVGHNEPGTQAGLDAMKAYVGNSGDIYIYPSTGAALNPGTLADSVTITIFEGGAHVVYSGAKIGGRPVQKFVGDVLVADGGLKLEDPGAGTNTIKIVAPSTPTTHTLTLPTASALGFLRNDGAGALTWNGGTTDTTNLAYLPGRTAGQTLYGSSATSQSSVSFLLLRGYTSTANSGQIFIDSDITNRCGNFNIYERATSNTNGWKVNTGVNLANVTHVGQYNLNPPNISDGIIVNMLNAGATNVAYTAKRKSNSSTGDLFQFLDETGAVMSRVDKSGNFTTSAAGSKVVADSANFKLGIFLGGDRITKVLMNNFTLDVGSISAATTRDETVTVTGLDVASNWCVRVQPLSAALNAGIGIVSARVSADNTIQVRFMNATASPVDPASQTFSYVAIK